MMRGNWLFLLLALGLAWGYAQTPGGQETSLHKAASEGNKELVEQLLAKGADLEAKSNDGATPLHAAASGGHKAVAELLLAKGAEVNAKNKEGQTPLDVAKTDEIKALLRKYAPKEEVPRG